MVKTQKLMASIVADIDGMNRSTNILERADYGQKAIVNLFELVKTYGEQLAELRRELATGAGPNSVVM